MLVESADLSGLAGRVAVVTGGTGVIGRSICQRLARYGVAVAVSGRNLDQLAAVVENIVAIGGRAIAVAADVTDPSAIEHLRDETERQLGTVDFVAAVAGGGGEPVALADLTLERWHATLDLNLTSAFLTLKTFLPALAAQRRGSVVTIASLAGQHIIPQAQTTASSAYAAAKAGLIMLTRHAAREYGPYNVRVNTISPGTVLSDRIAQMPNQVRENLDYAHPLRRIGQPDDVAGAVTYLFSDQAAWMTGSTLSLNGGFAML
jgi:3-oxoacyl-[acyl-carrier protein] reductase